MEKIKLSIKYLVCIYCLLGFVNCNKIETKPCDTSSVFVIELDNHSLRYLGGFPFERKEYVKIIEKVNSFDPSVIFLDVAFIKLPKPEDSLFAYNLNKTGKIISMIMPTGSSIKTNYTENIHSFGTQVKCIKFSSDAHFPKFRGIELPYSQIVENNYATSVSFVNHDKQQVKYMDFFGVFEEYLFENSHVTIVNKHIEPQGYNIQLGGDYNTLNLYKNNNLIKSIYKRGKDNSLKQPINFCNINSISVMDLFEKNVQIPKNKIILIGYNADGIGDKWQTPVGLMPGVKIIGNQVATLINDLEI